MKYDKLKSVVIVRNDFGAVATIRFSEERRDKIISTPSPKKIYEMVEDEVRKVCHD